MLSKVSQRRRSITRAARGGVRASLRKACKQRDCKIQFGFVTCYDVEAGIQAGWGLCPSHTSCLRLMVSALALILWGASDNSVGEGSPENFRDDVRWKPLSVGDLDVPMVASSRCTKPSVT